jgi:hypothetical protein
MATHHKVLIFVLALFVILEGFPASAQKAKPKNTETIIPANDVPWRVESKALRLKHELDKQGYEVLRGYFKLLAAKDCPLSYEVMSTCYGNNPAAPYVVPIVPPWPNEWVDENMIGALGETAPGYNGSYRFDPHEALVILAQMPPPAAFFSEQTYLFTRAGELQPDTDRYKTIAGLFPYLIPTFFTLVPHEPADAHRVEIMADVSNSNNSVVIKNQSHSVWEQLRIFVITPNPVMDTAIRDAFAKIGIEGKDIFTEKIPNHVGDPLPPPDDAAVRFGLGQEADDFVTVIRYAMPQARHAADRWRQQLPLVVLRIRNLAADVQTYDWPGFEQRTRSDPPETWYNAEPQNYLTALAQAVCDRWNGCTVNRDFFNLQLAPFWLTGPKCVPVWMNCLAPGEDSTYFFSGKLPLHDDDVYAAVGVLGTATGNATYVGLGLNSSLRQLGFDNISGDELEGSADGYTSAVPSDKFFVHYFARDCTGLESKTGGHCSSIGDQLPRDCDGGYAVENVGCDMLNLSLRAYVRPGTARASDPASALLPRVILLNRSNP